MKKILSVILAVTLVFSLAGCSKKGEPVGPTDPVPPVTEGYELALITDTSSIDDKSFNQGTWEGLKKYADENGKTYKYYKPNNNTTDEYLDTVALAVKGGAKVVIAPGYLFEQTVFAAQDIYPEVKFLILDATPCNADYSEFKTGANTHAILYSENQAGFLAGYAAVKDGYRNLGFIGGMAQPNVTNFGYGFAQGADLAGTELGLAKGDITLKFSYFNNFDPTPENQTLAASWFQNGVEVLFSAAGAAGTAVMSAAEAAGAKVIGVDVDQSPESDTVITSAMKGLGASVYGALTSFYADAFPGSEVTVLDASSHGVGLPIATSRFKTFSAADYETILEALSTNKNGIADSLKNADDTKTTAELPLSIVVITEI